MPIRKNLEILRDPYLPWGGLKGAVVCKQCGAVYRNKSWSLYAAPAALKGHAVRSIVCPACRKVHDHFTAGIVALRGEFLKIHKEQILHLVRNEEARAGRVNPLERIIAIKDKNGEIEISTTSERFAQRIGRKLERAYKGRTVYHWSGGDKQVRVEWCRAA